jgi:CRP/FNR family transcriptional regulator, cyclic AMP receptor protein
MGLFDYPVQGEMAAVAGAPPAFTFLEKFPEATWKKILAHVEVIHLAPGQAVIEAGARDDSFYILSAGAVDVVIAGSDRETVLATIPEGSVFGEIAFFDGEPRSATIRSKTDSTAIRVTRDNFERLSSWEPAIARAILFDLGKVLALRLRWTTKLTQS